MRRGSAAAVLDIGPLAMTCTFGQPDVQGEVHILAEAATSHAGLEDGRFTDRTAIPRLIRDTVNAAGRHAGQKVSGVYVSIPTLYTETHTRYTEVPLRGPVSVKDIDASFSLATEGPIPPDFRAVSCIPVCWQIDGELLNRSPVGMNGRLLTGYFALTSGYEFFCSDTAMMLAEAGISLLGWIPMPVALSKYAAHRLNLLDTFLLLDADELTTHILSARRGRIWFSCRIPVGLQRFIQMVMEATDLPYPEARAELLGTQLGPRGSLTEITSRSSEEIAGILEKAEQQLRSSALSLNEGMPLVLSGRGWMQIPGAADVISGLTASRVMTVPPSLEGASLHGTAMLHTVLTPD